MGVKYVRHSFEICTSIDERAALLNIAYSIDAFALIFLGHRVEQILSTLAVPKCHVASGAFAINNKIMIAFDIAILKVTLNVNWKPLILSAVGRLEILIST